MRGGLYPIVCGLSGGSRIYALVQHRPFRRQMRAELLWHGVAIMRCKRERVVVERSWRGV